MPDETVEAVRTPMTRTVHGRRRLEERLALRFPRLRNLVTGAIWRLPSSKMRRALVRRSVRTAWEAFNRGDLDAAFLLYHPDCESTYPPELATIGLGAGTHGLEERMRSQQRALDEWAEFRFEPKELIDFGDGRLLTAGHMKGTGLSSGATVDSEWSALVTTVNGRVIREQIYVNHPEALQAAGLS
jgi:ketosteroid isomerase-like protein